MPDDAEQDEAGEALKDEDVSRPEEIIDNEDADKEDNEGYFDCQILFSFSTSFSYWKS